MPNRRWAAATRLRGVARRVPGTSAWIRTAGAARRSATTSKSYGPVWLPVLARSQMVLNCVAAGAQLRQQPGDRFNGVPLIRERRRLVAVVHDDDVAVADAMANAAVDGVGGAALKPVPVPQHPAPADHPVVDLLQARIHRPAAPARVRAKRAGTDVGPPTCSMRSAAAVSVRANVVRRHRACRRACASEERRRGLRRTSAGRAEPCRP